MSSASQVAERCLLNKWLMYFRARLITIPMMALTIFDTSYQSEAVADASYQSEAMAMAAVRVQAAFRAWRGRQGFKVLRSYIADLRQQFVQQQVGLIAQLRATTATRLERLSLPDATMIQVSLRSLEEKLQFLEVSCTHVPTFARTWHAFSTPVAGRILQALENSTLRVLYPVQPSQLSGNHKLKRFAGEMSMLDFLHVLQQIRIRLPCHAQQQRSSGSVCKSSSVITVVGHMRCL